ncbi:MAG: cytochrome c biogenesis protein CcsA [Acidobacteriaceae bacterium]|nr:cytochrome c biogenesis protein CcsA [Acidobacteriaceae bacterium]
MPDFGSFSLLLALLLSGYNLIFGAVALLLARSGRGAYAWLGETARRAGIASFIALTAAAFALVWAAFTNDYSVSYVLHETNRSLSLPYKFAALWSGQEGSLLFWALLLAGFGFVLRLRYKVDARLTAYASTILAGVQVFFILLLNFVVHPFAIQPGPVAQDGFGLNPLLQYWEMVIHPPLLYMGYVGFAVPFAFALGALMMRYPGEKWIRITRRWTMVTWLLLTCGIFLGAHWAYSVLGWGGYWGWDPVENASLMPWLTGTAFLHSVVMQEKRGMMKSWNVWLIFTTFLLTILGTMLTRSGIVSSVHAFAASSIGGWFYAFLLIVLVVCLITYFAQRDHLKTENRFVSLASRESGFLFNNLILLLACLVVVGGTLLPVVTEYMGTKLTMKPEYYSVVTYPIGVFLLFLTGVGPLLAWRSTSFRAIRRNFVLPGLVTVAALALMMIFGLRPWRAGDDARDQFYALIALALAAGVITAIKLEFLRGARVIRRQTGKNLLTSSLLLMRRNSRRYGGYIVHFGIVLIFVGIAGGAFNQSREQRMGFGDSMQLGRYKLVCQSYSQDSTANYDTEFALLDVYRGEKHITELAPEQRFYTASQQGITRPAMHSTLLRDLYVVYEGRDPDTDEPIIKAMLHPLISWIWIGVLVVALGTLLALVPNPEPGAVRVRASVSVPVLKPETEF